MHEELLHTADFIIKVMKMSRGGYPKQIGEEKLDEFKKAIREELKMKYTGHWHPENSHKGSGFRCIKIGSKVQLENWFEKAILKVGLDKDRVHKSFTTELTMWVDPREVCYKLGQDGSHSTLYEYKPPSTSGNSISATIPTSISSSAPSKVSSSASIVSSSSMSAQAKPFVASSTTPRKIQRSEPFAGSSSSSIQNLPFGQANSTYTNIRQFNTKENYPPTTSMNNPQMHPMSNQQHWNPYPSSSYLPRHGPVPTSPVGLNSYPESVWINHTPITEGMPMLGQMNGLMVPPNGSPYNYPYNNQDINPYGEAGSSFDVPTTEHNR